MPLHLCTEYRSVRWDADVAIACDGEFENLSPLPLFPNAEYSPLDHRWTVYIYTQKTSVIKLILSVLGDVVVPPSPIYIYKLYINVKTFFCFSYSSHQQWSFCH